MAKPACILFLFDWQPVFWSTREEYFRQLSERLVARGITPVLMVPELKDPEVRRRFETAGARVELCSYQGGLLAYERRIRGLCREFSVQIAHVRFFDYFVAVPWLCRLAGIRTILFTEANSGEWTSTGWRAALVRMRTAFMCWPLTKCIAISQFIWDRLRKVGIPDDRLALVYNGIDVNLSLPEKQASCALRNLQGASPSTIVLIFAAALLPWKRPSLVLQTCAELVRRGYPVQLWMAGTGPLRAELERETEQMGIGTHVKWLGYQKDVRQWMAAANLFLHTAIGEAFGNVFMEAMHCGLPVVASASGSAPELIPEAVGLLVPPGANEAMGLADAILKITADPSRYARMSAAAKERSLQFSIEKSVSETLAVYDALPR